MNNFKGLKSSKGSIRLLKNEIFHKNSYSEVSIPDYTKIDAFFILYKILRLTLGVVRVVKYVKLTITHYNHHHQ